MLTQLKNEVKDNNISIDLYLGNEIFIDETFKIDTDILPEKMDLDIVYEDENIIVVNKPSGLLTVSTPTLRTYIQW